MHGAGRFQRLRRRGMQWGLAGENSQGTCRATRSSGCVVAKKSPCALVMTAIEILGKVLVRSTPEIKVSFSVQCFFFL